MILAIVDVQEMVVVKELYAYSTFVDNCKKLLQTARENGMEVVFVRHDDGKGERREQGDDCWGTD